MPSKPNARKPRIERVTICNSCGEPQVCITHEEPPTCHRCPRCGPRRARQTPEPESDPLEDLLDLREQEWDK